MDTTENQELTSFRKILQEEAVAFDDRESKKRGYNCWALTMYMENILKACSDPDFLKNPRKSLSSYFLIRGETGSINHRDLPCDLENHRFVLPFINKALKKKGF